MLGVMATCETGAGAAAFMGLDPPTFTDAAAASDEKASLAARFTVGRPGPPCPTDEELVAAPDTTLAHDWGRGLELIVFVEAFRENT